MMSAPVVARYRLYYLRTLAVRGSCDHWMRLHGSDGWDLGDVADRLSLGFDPLGRLDRLSGALAPGFYVVQVRRRYMPSAEDWGTLVVAGPGRWTVRARDGSVVAGPGFVFGGGAEWNAMLAVTTGAR